MSRPGLHRILLVDDEPDILAVTRMTLQARGDYEVETSESGREALHKALEFDPDLIVLDVMMPDMDGPATLTALRADPRTAHTPVVFMTAKTMRHEVERFIDLGAVGVVGKPYDPRTLVDELERIARGTPNLSRSEDSAMAELLESYAARLPQKVREIRDLWEQVERGADGASDRLHRSVHRIAGTAGTYGYRSLSDIGSQLELTLNDELAVGELPTAGLRRHVETMIDALEKAALDRPESVG